MMKSQGTYIKGGPVWRMEYDKENLEIKESLNRHGWLYILILRDQYIFDIICTCDWGVRVGSRNNFIPFDGQDWPEIMRDADKEGWVQVKMPGSGHLVYMQKNWGLKQKETCLVEKQVRWMELIHSYRVQSPEGRQTPWAAGLQHLLIQLWSGLGQDIRPSRSKVPFGRTWKS